MYFQSTPNGENHFYDIWKVATDYPDEWFSLKQTVKDTGVITQEQIDREIRDGLISRDMVLQEYFCDFTVGALGSYYSKYVNDLDLAEQIGEVAWDKGYPVWTFWDLGVDDHTAVIYAQFIGNKICIIDFDMDNNLGTEHYIKKVLEKPYLYAGHVWPHDGDHRQKMTGERLSDMAANLGLKTTQATQTSRAAGIEKVRRTFSKFWIDEGKCRKLITCMRDYRKKYNAETKKYSEEPHKDYTTDAMDALRYLCVTYEYLKPGMTEEDAERLQREALYVERR